MFERFILPIGPSRLIQFTMNVVPFFGVVFMNWSVFALIYAFWLETLGFSFFNAVRIAFAEDSQDRLPHISKALTYFMLRLLVLLFYMIFILAFIGFSIGSKQEGANFANYLLLLDPSFRFTIFTFFIVKFLELLYTYFYQNEKKQTSPMDFSAFFDTRIIIIHVVIVLGVFAFQFFSEKLDTHAGIIAFAGIFVLVKIIGEYFSGLLVKVKDNRGQ